MAGPDCCQKIIKKEGETMGQEMKRKTIVIGHRNPDTDSICSAICYANLKEKLTGQVYVPGRAGQVNWTILA